MSGNYNGPNGWNWVIQQMPFVVASGTSVAVVFNPHMPYWFDYSGGVYTPRYNVKDVSLTLSGTILTFIQTSNGQVETTNFNSPSADTNPGTLTGYTDSGGIPTTVTYSGPGITEMQRSYTLDGNTIYDSLVYAYFSTGLSAGKLQTVRWRQKVGTGSWTYIKGVAYAYYGASDPDGSVNDLRTATQQLPTSPDGSSWEDTAVNYYRYSGHLVTMHLGPQACLNVGYDFSGDLTPYADQILGYSYDPTYGNRVIGEVAAVCASCPGGGTTADYFDYYNPTLPDSPGYNDWAVRTTQTLPDGSSIVVYASIFGLTMLYVYVEAGTGYMWCTFYRYNEYGHCFAQAMPSAIVPASLATYEAYSDLMNFLTESGDPEYIKEDEGLMYFFDIGNDDGYLYSISVRQGWNTGDAPILVREIGYSSHTDALGNVVSPVGGIIDYPTTGSTPAITTNYYYTYHTIDGNVTNQVETITTQLPAVGTGQNGDGTAPTTVETYDPYGNLIQYQDERGTITIYTYDRLGQASEQVVNYQTSGSGPGINVTTDFLHDSQGRITQSLGPIHTVDLSGTATSIRPATWYVYLPYYEGSGVQWNQTLIDNGYASGTGYGTFTLIDPVTLLRADLDGRPLDSITSKRSSGAGALSPTDTFNQSDWQSWSSTQYSPQTDSSATPPTVAGQMVSSRVYFLIPTTTGSTGTLGVNYSETDYGYDALERRNRVSVSGGTATGSSTVFTRTWTVWTAPQRVASVWVGTDFTDGTDADPSNGGTSPNNMVLVTANVYDGGSAGGDGNLTQQTQYVSATSGDTRVTNFGYDFRDRRTSMTDALGAYSVYTYDNLDRMTEVDRYTAASGGTLFAQGKTFIDDRGRVYQTQTFAVNSSGTPGNALTSNIWYDYSGNMIQKVDAGDGIVFTKTDFNAVGWVTAVYRGYNTSGYSYGQAVATPGAGDAASDIIIGQVQNTFDEAGNIISQAMFDRLNDAPATGTGSTGVLSAGTNPKARISYSASWFDGIDRLIATGNYGAATSFSRDSVPPASGTSVLVSLTSYDSAGRVYETTDPNGIIAQILYDAAGRRTQITEDYGTASSNLNRITNWTYTLDNLIVTLKAVNGTTGDQVTTYAYGTTLAASGVARNDLLISVTYPDSSSGSDVVAYTYNRLGQQSTIADQRGTVRSLYYDGLGRLTNDCVSSDGTGTDVAVKQIRITYNTRGMAYRFTSLDSSTPGSGTILNDVQKTFNDFNQLTIEAQAHGGSVAGGTPKVQYSYDTGASGSNEIRLNTMTYPNSRVITYSYGTSGGMNDLLNRVDTIYDTTNSVDLASYTYLGAGTAVRITYPEPEVWLDLWGGTSGTFNGIDLFGRIIDQRWQNDITGTPTDIDRYKYGYDLNSNRQWKANLVATTAGKALDEYYNYDNLNRLTEMQRGTLNSTTAPTGITGTPARELAYGLDPTGNWSAYITATSGVEDLGQTRASNKVNEITGFTTTVGTAWATPGYDPAGNMTTMPQPASLGSSFTATYDAWNQMTSISETGGTVATYSYDGRGRRIIKVTTSSSETRHFYFTDDWQDVEERTGSPAAMENQHVWGIRYVDELICRDDATPQRLYATQDANFNLTSICDTSGAVQERFVYDPYGTAAVLTAGWTATTDAYSWADLFTGRQYDFETAIYQYRWRYNHPPLGTFMASSPWF